MNDSSKEKPGMPESAAPDPADKARYRIGCITLDEETLEHTNPDIEHERQVAIFDLLEENYFAPADAPPGPYNLHLSIVNRRLVLDIRHETDEPIRQIMLSLSPFRKIIKDYFLMCESYYHAIKTAMPAQIEAIDMGRRGMHNDGSEILIERLKDKAEIDFPTARRLFTLICVLHINL